VIGAWRLIGIGWYFVICIASGLVAGIWIDSLIQSSPLFTLLGLFIGIGAGFVGLFRMVTSVYQEMNSGGTKEKAKEQ
jgi:F0F1-type ATP synthase assembly protein I